MYEHTLKRLAKLEAWCGLRQQASGEVHSVFFAGGEEAVTHAKGPDNFRCYREPGESFVDFESRACWAALVAKQPNAPPPVLVFMSIDG